MNELADGFMSINYYPILFYSILYYSQSYPTLSYPVKSYAILFSPLLLLPYHDISLILWHGHIALQYSTFDRMSEERSCSWKTSDRVK